MIDRAVRLLVVLAVVMGLVVSLGPGTAVAHRETAVAPVAYSWHEPIDNQCSSNAQTTRADGKQGHVAKLSADWDVQSRIPTSLNAAATFVEAESPSMGQSAADGVDYSYENGMHILLVDLTDPTIRFETVIADDFDYVNVEWCDGQPCYPFPVESVGHIATRDPYRDQGVIAAVNADYFAYNRSHGPEGLTVKNGRRIDGHHSDDNDGNEERRSSLAISANNEANIGRGLGTQQPYLYNAVGGGPQIISNGQYIPIQQACSNEGFGAYWCNETTATAQTAVGLSHDRRTLVLAVSSESKTASQVAQALINRGAWTGIKLDGGGSSQLWYDGQTLRRGSRDIANALLIFRCATENSAPSIPNLLSPYDWYVSRDGAAPQLCWSTPIDPDGDQLEFYAEVYESTVNDNSGWISDTCWRPDQLDGHHHGYQWHVKARDVPHHDESDWSTTWHFRIEEPNEPPSISFDTANGDSFPSGRIESRDRDWTFRGTASDPEDHLDRIEFYCSGDNRGYQAGHSDGTNWSHTQNNMSGQNDVYFRAYDDRGQGTSSRHLDLNIDLAAPSTSHNLIGTMGQNDWYVSPVEVRLHAEDGSTGHARVEVREIRYRLDGGGWQTYNGDNISFAVNTDGMHMVEYYAVDNVGNTESSHSVTFKIDATPPTAPGAAAETHGAVSGQWQKDWPDPDFTWGPANDTTSGVSHYHVNWSNLADKWVTTPAYDPPAVPTGEHQLHVYARDSAGNVGPEGPVFTFRYDGTPPHAPDVENNYNVSSGVWQNQVRTANFSWPTPHDEGSGIAGYNVYWGPDPGGTSHTLRTSNDFVDTAPICAEDEAASYYLRARSQDNVGWQSEWVGYALAYDGAPPTATLVANYGLDVTHQTNVHLDIVADDEGSGVAQMRLSNDGRNWSEWMDFVDETYREIPAIGRRFHSIYLQVMDGAQNMSEVVSDKVYLEVNRSRPKSDNFWLWDDMMTVGGVEGTSTSYNLRSSLGQSLDSPQSISANYVLRSGFQAGVLAVPTETPTYTSYSQLGYVIAGGGACTPTLMSSSYWMYGTLGQPAHVRVITSVNYILQSGFWGSVGTDVELPEPPEPEPPEPPECEFYSITINDDAAFTNQPGVALDLCGPDPVEVMLSNSEGFSGAAWQPYTRTVPWTLEVHGDSVQPRFVYARFRDSDGTVHSTFFDDIIYDPNAPEGDVAFDLADLMPTTRLQSGTQSLQVVAQDSVELFLSAADDSSGLREVQVSLTPDFEGATWEPYSAIVPVTFAEDGAQTVYVRVRDHSGNVSDPSSDSLIVDTTPPIGGASVMEGVVGSDAISVTVALGAEDNATGVSEVRISALESFTDTLWQTYASQVAVPISYAGEEEPTLYVQFRDGAGNASSVYSTTYLVDTAPPVLYVEVAPGATLTRTVTVLAYDELAGLGQMWVSNDPFMIDDVLSMPYTATVTWTLDERRVVWVQVADSIGNASDPYPAYGGEWEFVYLPVVVKNQ